MTRITYSTAAQDMTPIYQAFEYSLTQIKNDAQKNQSNPPSRAQQWLEKWCPYDTRLMLGRFPITQADALDEIFNRSR